MIKKGDIKLCKDEYKNLDTFEWSDFCGINLGL